MAYRGRLLVELESKLGEEIDKELEAMAPAELVRVQVGYLIYASSVAYASIFPPLHLQVIVSRTKKCLIEG